MGRRGPPPEPTRLRLLKGNPGKRRVNSDEPKPPRRAKKDLLRCPGWISDGAKLVWRSAAPQLRDMGVLTQVDRDALAAYCQAYARWREAEEFIAKHGSVYPLRDEQGRVKYMQPFPQVAIARHLLLAVRTFQQEFGMTPSARSRIHGPAEPDAGEFESFRDERRTKKRE